MFANDVRDDVLLDRRIDERALSRHASYDTTPNRRAPDRIGRSFYLKLLTDMLAVDFVEIFDRVQRDRILHRRVLNL